MESGPARVVEAIVNLWFVKVAARPQVHTLAVVVHLACPSYSIDALLLSPGTY